MDTLFSHVSIVTMDDRMSVWTDSFLGVTDGKISYLGKKAPEEQPQTIIDAALSKRPSAAVAVGSVLWICLARSTIPVEVMATAFTHPSFVIARTSSSFMSFPFSPRDKRAAHPPSARGISGRRRRRSL